MGIRAFSARKRTASGKGRFLCFLRKVIALPLAPQPKQRKIFFSGLTLSDGVLSS
jgi:hypothetical protein